MKTLLPIALGGLFIFHSALGDCRLDFPVALKGKTVLQTNQTASIVLEHVKLDKAYETKVIPPVTSIANLTMKIFEISWSEEPWGDAHPTGWAGASFGPPDSLDSAGFSFNYGGRFLFEGKTENSGSNTIYKTTVKSQIEKGTTAVTISTDGDFLTAVEITIPVMDQIALSGGGFYTPYLGRDETLCVKAATLRE